MLNGIVNVYKEKGYTSFDVVAKLRGILKMRKIGHTGTLDPEAEGVLLVCTGRATKVCGLLTDRDKEYETVLLLGVTTDTQDLSGTVLSRREVSVTAEEVEAVIRGFAGEYLQVPPMYSALKVGGKKLCDLARAGVTVERKARPVTIHEITISEVCLPRVRMRVKCSKGTYIRTLCQDIGERLGCGACMESLLRTQVSDFSVETALRLSEIEDLVRQEASGVPPEQWKSSMFSFLQPVDVVFLGHRGAVVQKDYYRLLYNGGKLRGEMLCGVLRTGERPADGAPSGGWTDRQQYGETAAVEPSDIMTPAEAERFRIYDEEGNFAGIYEYSQGRSEYKPAALFLTACDRT